MFSMMYQDISENKPAIRVYSKIGYEVYSTYEIIELNKSSKKS